MNWPLNWKEIHHLVELMRTALHGLKLSRVFVPRRDFLKEKHFLGEWVLEFKKPKSEINLILSLRPQAPYFCVEEENLSRSFPRATRSAFDLEMEKTLEGQKVLSIEALPNDRTILYRFEDHTLVHSLIPARPNLQLIRNSDTFLVSDFRNPQTRNIPWDPPQALKPEKKISNRLESIRSMEAFRQKLDETLRSETLGNLEEQLARAKEKELISARKRLESLEAAKDKLLHAPPWSKFGDILKAHLHEDPKPSPDGKLYLTDPLSDSVVALPFDAKLSGPQLLDSFYQKARKTSRQLEDTERQILESRKRIAAIESEESTSPTSPPPTSAEKKEKSPSWSGASFLSASGFRILVGKNEKENHRLTFQIARGNDHWFHVRGKPSSHVVVMSEKGKTVDLDTLLDAAHIVLAYSGGKKWGKTEIDYTLRKNVQSIRGSKKVSYRGNKTLLVDFDSDRWESIRKRSQ